MGIQPAQASQFAPTLSVLRNDFLSVCFCGSPAFVRISGNKRSRTFFLGFTSSKGACAVEHNGYKHASGGNGACAVEHRGYKHAFGGNVRTLLGIQAG